MQLPYLQTNDKDLNLLQTKWRAILNPALAQPFTNGLLLDNISIAVGVNVINHKLGRKMQGWVLTDVTTGAQIYRSQPFNDKTITLTSNAISTIALWVY